ncbi:MAG TPA: PilZ domain-containing protein [Gammaproteobacteria bacterium]|nr:PilZ domain-containing protein [Gammaproteobacteria bacterium]
MLRNEYAEKRDFIRMSVNSRLKFRVQSSEIMHDGRITDLSGSGISFVTTSKLNAEAKLAVAVESSSQNIPPLVAHVVVVRCDKNPESDEYTVACKIDQIHPANYPDSDKP